MPAVVCRYARRPHSARCWWWTVPDHCAEPARWQPWRAAAARNGWAGVVIDGCVRDVAELAQQEVGIRALASVPMPTEKKNQGLTDVPVQIQGVWVHPGDWLYADADGMVVSDKALALNPVS
jgi:regulator of RNase E activity RraA